MEIYHSLIIFILIGWTIVRAAIHNETFSQDASFLRVLNLNTWGLSWPWGTDRTARFRALRYEIIHGNYDIVLLQEVWFRKDYDIIRNALPYVSYYRTLNTNCYGKILPIGCSGLAILSKYPIEDVRLQPFSQRGTFWNFDGEIFVGKGVGIARVRWRGFTVDIFTTHMISYTNNPNRDNTLYRFLQTLETVGLIKQSNADIKLFGGDLNALPLIGPRQPYSILTESLTDSLTDKFPDASFHPFFATFGNERNTYTSDDQPERIDYLMYAAAPHVKIKTYEYSNPLIWAKTPAGSVVSVSDHEPILAVFIIERRNKPPKVPILSSSNSPVINYSRTVALREEDQHYRATRPSRPQRYKTLNSFQTDISQVESNDLSLYS